MGLLPLVLGISHVRNGTHYTAIFIQKRLSTESGSAHYEDTPVATKRARNMSREESDESAAGGRGRRGSFGRQRRKSGRRMSFGGLRRAAAG